MSGINDFVVKFATVNGSGSASANGIFAKTLFRMGIPVSPKNIFPSNIQGLPTWYEVRVSEAGYLARRDGIDLMVAMNPQSYKEDVAEIVPGGWLLYDSTLPRIWPRDDITVLGVPIAEMCAAKWSDTRQRQLFKNMVYVGALTALLDIDLEILKAAVADQLKGKEKLVAANMEAVALGRDYAARHFDCPLPIRVRHAEGAKGKILVSGNDAAGLGAIYAGATVCAWYPITPSTSLAEAYEKYARRLRTAKDGRRLYGIVQAEDELAAIGVAIGGGWNGARAFTATSGPGISLMSEFLGLAYFAEVPVVLFNIQRGGPSTGMPTRTQQSDIISCAYASHGDTKHVLLFPKDPNECFSMGAQAFDLAERLQTPVIVMSDLDIGMNDWVTDAVRLGRCPRARSRQGAGRRDAREVQGHQGQGLGPLPGHRRRRHPLPHAARHASDQGRLLHPRHLARRERALYRGRPHPRPRARSHPPQVRHRADPGAEARDRRCATRAARPASSTSAPTRRPCTRPSTCSSATASRSTRCASRPSRSRARWRPSAPCTSACWWSSRTATRRCARS